jgi:hypothetical protein
MKCFGCGVEKDLEVWEVSPHHEEDGLCDEPLPPLFVVECGAGQMAVVCHECFHTLSPDMWISRRCWESINPTIPFERLPAIRITGLWNPRNYQPLPEDG